MYIQTLDEHSEEPAVLLCLLCTHNSQDIKSNYVSTNRGLDEENSEVRERIICNLHGERSLSISDGPDKSGDIMFKQRPGDRKVNSMLLAADGGYKDSGEKAM